MIMLLEEDLMGIMKIISVLQVVYNTLIIDSWID